MPGLRKTHFCTDDLDSINYEEYKGPIQNDHVNSREIKVPRFKDNNLSYLNELSSFVNSCILKVKDDVNSVLINLRLGNLYFDAKSKGFKNSHNEPRSKKRRQDFNSEAGASFEENRESVEEYVSQKGFTSKHTNEKLKVNCNGGNRYAYEMENLNPVVDDICKKLGRFDIVHNRNESYLEDVRVQIRSLKPANSSPSSSRHVARNENGDIILVNPKKVHYVRKQESSVYCLNEEQSQLDGISMYFRLDKKTQLDHRRRTLDRCMTTFTGAQIIISGSKDTFKQGKEFNQNLSEILYEYCEWLSKMCAELDVGTDYSVLYYEPGSEQGYTREQDLIIQEIKKELSELTIRQFHSRNEFTKWRNYFGMKLESANNHARYSETRIAFKAACHTLSERF